jgi:hypothetical protein
MDGEERRSLAPWMAFIHRWLKVEIAGLHISGIMCRQRYIPDTFAMANETWPSAEVLNKTEVAMHISWVTNGCSLAYIVDMPFI